MDDKVLHIPGHELNLVPNAGELIVILEDGYLFFELLVGFVVAQSAHVDQQLVLVLVLD